MPGNYLIAEDYSRLLRDFAAEVSTGCEPSRMKAKDADYDPLRLRPVGDSASTIEKLLGVETDVPMAWRLGQYWAAKGSDLMVARALCSSNIGEALEVACENQRILTNTRTISHRSRGDGEMAAIHHGENVESPVTRFIFHAIVAAKLTHFFNLYGASDRQYQLDTRAGCFGSLLQRFDRELDFVDIEFRDSEATFAFSRDILAYRLPNRDQRLNMALDRELRLKVADVPATARWKDRIKYYIRSNHLADISLDEICRAFCVQRRTLGRLLRDEGTTFTVILKELRQEKALHLVQQTRVPLKRVATELGFNSDASFNMAFKSWTGTTPMKFRKSPEVRLQANDSEPPEWTRAG